MGWSGQKWDLVITFDWSYWPNPNASELYFARYFQGHPTWPYLARTNMPNMAKYDVKRCLVFWHWWLCSDVDIVFTYHKQSFSVVATWFWAQWPQQLVGFGGGPDPRISWQRQCFWTVLQVRRVRASSEFNCKERGQTHSISYRQL